MRGFLLYLASMFKAIGGAIANFYNKILSLIHTNIVTKIGTAFTWTALCVTLSVATGFYATAACLFAFGFILFCNKRGFVGSMLKAGKQGSDALSGYYLLITYSIIISNWMLGWTAVPYALVALAGMFVFKYLADLYQDALYATEISELMEDFPDFSPENEGINAIPTPA